MSGSVSFNTGADGQGMQCIDHHGAELYLLVAITELPQHFQTLPVITKESITMDAR